MKQQRRLSTLAAVATILVVAAVSAAGTMFFFSRGVHELMVFSQQQQVVTAAELISADIDANLQLRQKMFAAVAAAPVISSQLTQLQILRETAAGASSAAEKKVRRTLQRNLKPISSGAFSASYVFLPTEEVFFASKAVPSTSKMSALFPENIRKAVHAASSAARMSDVYITSSGEIQAVAYARVSASSKSFILAAVIPVTPILQQSVDRAAALVPISIASAKAEAAAEVPIRSTTIYIEPVSPIDAFALSAEDEILAAKVGGAAVVAGLLLIFFLSKNTAVDTVSETLRKYIIMPDHELVAVKTEDRAVQLLVRAAADREKRSEGLRVEFEKLRELVTKIRDDLKTQRDSAENLQAIRESATSLEFDNNLEELRTLTQEQADYATDATRVASSLQKIFSEVSSNESLFDERATEVVRELFSRESCEGLLKEIQKTSDAIYKELSHEVQKASVTTAQTVEKFEIQDRSAESGRLKSLADSLQLSILNATIRLLKGTGARTTAMTFRRLEEASRIAERTCRLVESPEEFSLDDIKTHLDGLQGCVNQLRAKQEATIKTVLESLPSVDQRYEIANEVIERLDTLAKDRLRRNVARSSKENISEFSELLQHIQERATKLKSHVLAQRELSLQTSSLLRSLSEGSESSTHSVTTTRLQLKSIQRVLERIEELLRDS